VSFKKFKDDIIKSWEIPEIEMEERYSFKRDGSQYKYSSFLELIQNEHLDETAVEAPEIHIHTPERQLAMSDMYDSLQIEIECIYGEELAPMFASLETLFELESFIEKREIETDVTYTRYIGESALPSQEKILDAISKIKDALKLGKLKVMASISTECEIFAYNNLELFLNGYADIKNKTHISLTIWEESSSYSIFPTSNSCAIYMGKQQFDAGPLNITTSGSDIRKIMQLTDVLQNILGLKTEPPTTGGRRPFLF
jgi:hypothetical protein